MAFPRGQEPEHYQNRPVPVDAPVRELAIPSSLANLEHTLAGLEHNAAELANRLLPVMRQEPSSGNTGNGASAPSVPVELAAQVDTLNRVAQRVQSVLLDVIARLEV